MSAPHSPHATPLPAPTEMEEAALAWFARCQRGLSEEQEVEFQNWLAADVRHATLFSEFDGTWMLLDRARGTAPAPVMTRPRWQATLFRYVLPLAAVVAIAFTYAAWWRPAHYSGEVATEVGDLRTLRLPDGSQVTLNTDSVVAAAFTPAERRIRLERGEAHFAVAKNLQRPFIVEAGGVSVRAVGTAFNVRLAPGGVEVLVTEGKVRVDDTVSGHSLLPSPAGLSTEALAALGQPVLSSGQRVVVDLSASAARAEAPAVVAAALSAGEIQRALAWQEGRLEFELATLGEIVAEFNRYSQHRLVIADPGLALQRFGGSFKPDDQAGFVRMLQENFGVVVQETEAATVLRAGSDRPAQANFP